MSGEYPLGGLSLGEYLVVMRRRRELSASRVADELGVTAGTLVSWEWDRTRPKPPQLARLVELLELDADVLAEVTS